MMLLIEDSEPPTFMTQLDPKLPTHAVEIGHKGKYVGLVGVYRDGKQGYRLHYQKILMSEDWETPAAKKAKQPIIALMERYNLELKSQDMLAKAPRSPHYNQIPDLDKKGLKATYVGSARCESCHEHAHDVWANSPHAKAMDTLEKEKFPSNRHYDPECVKCHTTGFQQPGGYNDLVLNIANWPAPPAVKPTAAQLAKHNTNLRGVGCESCHGPASEHVKNTKDADIRKLINPYRPTPEERKLEDALVKNPKDAQALQQWLKMSKAAAARHRGQQLHQVPRSGERRELGQRGQGHRRPLAARSEAADPSHAEQQRRRRRAARREGRGAGAAADCGAAAGDRGGPGKEVMPYRRGTGVGVRRTGC